MVPISSKIWLGILITIILSLIPVGSAQDSSKVGFGIGDTFQYKVHRYVDDTDPGYPLGVFENGSDCFIGEGILFTIKILAVDSSQSNLQINAELVFDAGSSTTGIAMAISLSFDFEDIFLFTDWSYYQNRISGELSQLEIVYENADYSVTQDEQYFLVQYSASGANYNIDGDTRYHLETGSMTYYLYSEYLNNEVVKEYFVVQQSRIKNTSSPDDGGEISDLSILSMYHYFAIVPILVIVRRKWLIRSL